MTFSRVVRAVGRVVLRTAIILLLLFWSLNPLMQHAIDRTPGFWIAWALIEIVLLAALIGSFVMASRRK